MLYRDKGDTMKKLLILAGILLLVGCGGEKTPDLNAEVRYMGGTFMVTNNDTYNWTNCRVSVNGDYKLKNQRYNAGEQYLIDATGFVDSNGKRFNTYTHKVQDIFFYCDNAQGKRASYMGSWK